MKKRPELRYPVTRVKYDDYLEKQVTKCAAHDARLLNKDDNETGLTRNTSLVWEGTAGLPLVGSFGLPLY